MPPRPKNTGKPGGKWHLGSENRVNNEFNGIHLFWPHVHGCAVFSRLPVLVVDGRPPRVRLASLGLPAYDRSSLVRARGAKIATTTKQRSKRTDHDPYPRRMSPQTLFW